MKSYKTKNMNLQLFAGYSSTISLTNCTCNKQDETGLSGSYSATITADDGYYLYSVVVNSETPGFQSQVSYTYDEYRKTATVTISNVTEDFTIVAVGYEKGYTRTILHPCDDIDGQIDYSRDLLVEHIDKVYWYINKNPNVPSGSVFYYQYFTSNGNNYSLLRFSSNKIYYNDTEVYDTINGWIDENFRTLEYRKEEQPRSNYLTWLQSNAVKTEVATKAYVDSLIITTINGSY